MRPRVRGAARGDIVPRMDGWLFENPWPLAIALAVVGAALAWRGASEGESGRNRPVFLAGAALLALAVGAVALGRAVETPGERAAEVVRALVDHAENARTDRAMALFAPDAVLNYGRRENPGVAIDDIHSALRSLEGRYRIESNRIRRLELRTLDAATGEVELSCSTEIRGAGSAIPTDWVIRVRKSGTDWRIDRITFESLFGKAPTPGIWR